MKRKKGKLKERKLPAVLTKDEVFRYFGIAESPKKQLVLKTLYYTGMRVGELVQLTKEDVNFKEDVIRIRAETTKTKREELQPIPKVLKEDLKNWCSFIKNDEDAFLFKGHKKGTHITKQAVWLWIKEYTKKLKIKKNVHPHTFRHTYATHIYEETNDLGKVQELLRHSSLASTGIYKHLSKKLKKKTVDDVFK